MPKSWIDRSSEIAEGRYASATDGAQYQAPRFTVPQDDEDIFHGAEVRSEAGPTLCTYSRMGAEADAGPMPCTYSRMGAEADAGPMPCTYSRMGAEADAGPMPCTYSRMGAEAGAGPMPCTYSRMGAEIAAVEYPRPFCANCRAPEAGLEAIPPCAFSRMSDAMEVGAQADSDIPPLCGFCRMPMDALDQDISLDSSPYSPLVCRAPEAGMEALPPCLACRVSDDIDLSVLGDSYPPPCGFPCRMSDDIEIGALANNIPPPFCAWCRLSAEGSASALPPCAGACRMSDDVEFGTDIEMTTQAQAIPYPCLPPRMPESLQASATVQLPPPAYYCRQSR